MRAALVTGVSRRAGIGFAIVGRLEDAGARVFTQGWSQHDAVQPWGADDAMTPSIEADFADPDAPRRVVAAARDAVGPLDTLVVNHARSGLGRLEDLTAAELDAFLHENVRAALLLVREFAAQFEGDSGRVVLITSGAHRGPMTREVAYAVSKGALAVATETLAAALADRGVTVNCVNPGPTIQAGVSSTTIRSRACPSAAGASRTTRPGWSRGSAATTHVGSRARSSTRTAAGS